MTTYLRGQICLVNFEPSIGHEYKKVRPALIIQQSQYAQQGNLLTVIPLSSKTAITTVHDILIPKDPKNRLMKNSLLKTYKLSSFDKSRFIKYIGVLNDTLMIQVDIQIQKFLFGE